MKPFLFQLLEKARPAWEKAQQEVKALLGGPEVAGSYAIYLMIQQRGVSNEKAKTLLSWHPKYRSWREGFAEGSLQPSGSFATFLPNRPFSPPVEFP